MNELFNNGDYVLLEDCKAFDDKFGLEKDTIMWSVARKMEGGEPNREYMSSESGEKFVGIDFCSDVGLWYNSGSTKLSVEDVLYRSKDGLTLDELSEIHGAFEDGKQYECVGGGSRSFIKGDFYTANGKGIVDNDGDLIFGGDSSKLKPVPTKPEWVPSVGDEVMTSWGKVNVKFIKDKQACVEFESGSIDVVQLSCLMPIDQERERIINKAIDVINNKFKIDNAHDDIGIALYDAGMLKEGDK